MYNDDYIYHNNVDKSVAQWIQKAQRNVAKWGLQDPGTLLLATQEELGEFSEETYEGVRAEHPNLSAAHQGITMIGNTVQRTLEDLHEDEDGNPVDDRPTFTVDEDQLDIERLESELEDTAALLIQLQATIEAIKEKN